MKYQRANYTPRRCDDATDIALAAIYAALFPNAELGWNEWSSYAANGEWV